MMGKAILVGVGTAGDGHLHNVWKGNKGSLGSKQNHRSLKKEEGSFLILWSFSKQ
jgi:hypothetical protein